MSPAAGSPGVALRPGLCSITFRARPWEQVVELSAAAGLEGVEWGGDVHVPPGDVARADAVARRCRAAGLACPSYGSYLRAGELAADEVVPVLDVAEALGAGNVRVWCRWLSAADAGDDDRAAMAADLEQVAVAAADRGLTVSLEHHRFTLTETAASTLALLHAVGAPNLFTYWQPCEGMAVPELLAEVEALGPELSHLHVFHWSSFEDRHPLADGADLWPAALAAVAARPGRWAAAERWALLEYVRGDDPAQLHADAATLRAWLDRAG